MKTLTAKEFLQDYIEETPHDANIDIEEVMIEFAKLHVKTALEAAAAKAVEIQKPTARKYVSKKELIGSYPLTNIK